MEDPVVACAGGRISCLSVCLETAQSVRKWREKSILQIQGWAKGKIQCSVSGCNKHGRPGHLGGLYVDRIFWRGWLPHIPPTPCSDKKKEKMKSQAVSSERWCLEVVPVWLGSWWYITVPTLGCRSLSWVLARNWKANPTHTCTKVSPSPVSGKLRRIPTV